MKLSERLRQDHECGDFGKALDGYAEMAAALEAGLENAMLFAEWIECLGRTDCEIYKHELKVKADKCIERIDRAFTDSQES